METNDATAELVLSNIELPEPECGAPPCRLGLEDLQALDFDILNPEPGLSTVSLGLGGHPKPAIEGQLKTGHRE
jgi:hypothetical protein